MSKAKFEIITKYQNSKLDLLPKRKTDGSAGYDFYVAEDTIIPPLEDLQTKMSQKFLEITDGYVDPITLEEMASFTKSLSTRPTLVPTGIKAYLPESTYLELTVRSSTPLKYWLVMANSVGIIDSDYYNNPDNEGHIYFQLINLSPIPIQLKAGDCIGQGIVKRYFTQGEVKFNKVNNSSNADTNHLVVKARKGGFGSTDLKTSKKLFEVAREVQRRIDEKKENTKDE